jgi:hypothetical protein
MTQITVSLPEELVRRLEDSIRQAVVDALADEQPVSSEGFLDVAGAAAFLRSTTSAIRSLVKRNAIPFHRAPNGRLLFDRGELEAWVRLGAS